MFYLCGRHRDVILPRIVLGRFEAVLEPTKQVLDMKTSLYSAESRTRTRTESMSKSSPFPPSYRLTRAAREHVLRNLEASAYTTLLDGEDLTPGNTIHYPAFGDCDAVSLVVLDVPEYGPVSLGLPGEEEAEEGATKGS